MDALGLVQESILPVLASLTSQICLAHGQKQRHHLLDLDSIWVAGCPRFLIWYLIHVPEDLYLLTICFEFSNLSLFSHYLAFQLELDRLLG